MKGGSMDKGLERAVKDLKRLVSVFVRKNPDIRAFQPEGQGVVVEVNVRFAPIAADSDVILSIQQGDVRLEKSDVPFTQEHFEELLALPFSGLDKNFIEFCRKHGNSVTPSMWWEAGFSQHGRLASINRMCKMHGLHVRFLAIGNDRHSGSWWDREYRFFVMKEK